jgi:hypothetical protein
MIALLIGGTVVLCAGLLTVVFGIPIKEFSFGNTMILAGAGVSCTGLLLIGLYFVGREFRNLARRLDAGMSAVPGNREATDLVDVIRSGKNGPDQVSPVPTGRSVRDDMLFARDRSDTSQDFAGRSPQESLHAPRSGSSAVPSDAQAPWQDELTRPRSSASAADTSESGSPSSQRQRRNLLFSSKRREQTPREQDAHEESSADHNSPQHQPAEDSPGQESGQRQSGPEAGHLFETAWPQRERPRRDPALQRNSRPTRAPASEGNESAEAPRERYQSPRRAEAESVSIVKSGVVDSMAYSLYSDGSIEAQMPEGMVRFASIEELRAHLDQRG